MCERSLLGTKQLPRVGLAAMAVAVLLADQTTKWLAQESIPEHSVIPIIPRCFNLTHLKNTGAAFGLFSDSPAPWKTALLIVASVALLAVLVGMVWRCQRFRWPAGVGLALVLGGAFSNLLDRARFGRVVDFLDFYFQSYHWPAFNLADSAIVVGAGFLILHLVFSD